MGGGIGDLVGLCCGVRGGVGDLEGLRCGGRHWRFSGIVGWGGEGLEI